MYTNHQERWFFSWLPWRPMSPPPPAPADATAQPEAPPPSPEDECLKEFLKLQEKTLKEMERRRQEDLEAAQEAEAAGTGPQPWDRDWIEQDAPGEVFAGLLRRGRGALGRHAIQDLIEVLDWARSSPLGQLAVALEDEPNSPLSDPLRLIDEIRPVLVEQSRALLLDQARAMSYSTQWRSDLVGCLGRGTRARRG